MHDEFLAQDWQIFKLISEQANLARKKEALTPVEKREFRMRARKIRLLLSQTRSEIQKRAWRWRGLDRFLVVVVVSALLVLGACSEPRFVHMANRNQYVLYDRKSGELCWSGPENDLQAFMNGSVTGSAPQKPPHLRPCVGFRK